MRVVHVIKVVRVAGAERHLLTLLAGLRDKQIDASMLLLVEPGNDMQDYVEMLDALSIPVKRVLIRNHADVGVVERLRAELVTLQPHVAHTHLIHADVFGIPAARRAGIPVVVTSRHNDDAFRHRMPVKLTNRVLWRMVDAGVAISESLRRFSIEVEGAPAGKMHCIHYGLDTRVKPLERKPAQDALKQELGLSADSILMGLVCRLVEQKGVRYALEAFQQVATDSPDAHLLIAGEGPLRAALQAQANSAGLGKRVHFLGWRGDIPVLMAGLDVFLIPSLWEGFGLVMLEAMAQQRPIIGSGVSAIPEVVHDGETGLLVPPRDPAQLAQAMRLLLVDKPLRQHMGLLGRDRLETHFSAEKMVEDTAALYHTLVDGL